MASRPSPQRNKLVADRVVAVFGHQCSGAAIPASKIYANAGILDDFERRDQPEAHRAGLHQRIPRGRPGRHQGRIAGDLLAERWSGKPIAILHDGQAYGKGLAEETKKRLNEAASPRPCSKRSAGQGRLLGHRPEDAGEGIEVLYFGGYPHEAG